VSAAYKKSGKLASSTRPIYPMVAFPNVRRRHRLSARDLCRQKFSFPKGTVT
jgi:hypothetical protein